MNQVICKAANAAMIKWVRERAGYSIENLVKVKYIGLSKEEYEDIEKGIKPPTFRTLKNLAKKLKRPVAIFFLPDVPQYIKEPKDYRKLGEEFDEEICESFRVSQRVQYHYQDLFAIDRTIFWSDSDDLAESAASAKRWLGVSLQEQLDDRSMSRFYKLLMRKLENKGILVLQHSFSIQQARAYSIADEVNLIVVNIRKQNHGSRIFSVLHELYHLKRKQSAVCGIQQTNDAYLIERQCDQFAAHFIMPSELMERAKDQGWFENILDNGREFAKAANKLKCSQHALLIRLEELKYITRTQLLLQEAEWAKRPQPKQTTSKGRMPVAPAAVHHNGYLFSSLVFDSYATNQFTAIDASRMLDINQASLQAVGNELDKRAAN